MRRACAMLLTLAVLAGPAAAEPPHHPMHADATPPQTELRETVDRVPVSVTFHGGETRTGDMAVTHYRPSGDGPFPAIVIQHGRADSNRLIPWRWRAVSLARFWTRRGFAVFVVTRLGYGMTGLAPDPEVAGRCASPSYGPMVDVLRKETVAVVDFAMSRPWVDRSRVLLMGQSLGGLAVIATNAAAIPGVRGAISFSGGAGVFQDIKAGPCHPERLGEVLSELGATAKTPPSLWIYAENDSLWGAELPREWHQAYVVNGAPAEFVMLPPMGQDGHDFRAAGFARWRPLVDRFIARLGFPPPRTRNAPPASHFAPIEDTARVPISDKARIEGYQRFLAADLPRAFVIGRNGAWSAASGNDSLDRALARCHEIAKAACRAYAVDDDVVWKGKP